MLAAAGIWVVGLWQDVRKYLLLPLIVAGAYIGNAQFLEYSEHFSSDGVLTNLIRFLLTPVPWSVSEGWEFITVPSILHWVLFLPAVIGGLMLWRESLYARLPLVYFLVASVLYALTDDLLGPRHRLQVAFIILWSQFHLFWRLRHEELPNAQAADPTITISIEYCIVRDTPTRDTTALAIMLPTTPAPPSSRK